MAKREAHLDGGSGITRGGRFDPPHRGQWAVSLARSRGLTALAPKAPEAPQGIVSTQWLK